MDKIKNHFDSHPNRNVVFETSDGLLFHQDGDAALHAKGLDSKAVTTHLREVVMSEKAVDTMPVIDKVEVHTDVKPAGQDGKTIAAQELQIPVTKEVKEQLAVSEKATGDTVTNTESTKGAAETQTEVKAVTTDTGEGAANTAATPAQTKAEKAAEKAAKAAEGSETK